MKKHVLIFIALLCLLVFAQQEGSMSPQESLPVTGTFTDPRDGQTYRTVKIGNLMWMAENLNFQTDDSWCYDNADSNCVKYGRLYTWDIAMTVCPAGWKLPDTSDWKDLLRAAGCEDVDKNWRDRADTMDIGKRLRFKTGWVNPDGKPIDYGTNNVGFSALPGGYRHSNDYFIGIGDYGSWWDAMESLSTNLAGIWSVHYEDRCVRRNITNKDDGRSVRCVMEVVREP